jgi:hypothetical protein
VDSASPGLNTGGLPYLRTVGVASVGRAYVRFDASGLGGAAVLHAKLSLRTLTEGRGALRSSLGVAWDEATLTWANAPVVDAGSLGTIPSWSGDSTMCHDVTAYVAGDADGVVTLVVEGADPTVRRWQARESGEAPRLVLTVATSRVTVRLEKDAGGGVWLRWNDTGAAPYVVRRAPGPTPSDFDASVDVPVAATEYLDPPDAGDAWYLVEKGTVPFY